MLHISYLTVGLIVGTLSGFLGIGGGLLSIPIMIYIYGLTQHQAQGTSLAAMVPPITILAAMRYYHSGNVKLGMAIFIACGFALGGLMGAHLVHFVPEAVLRKFFGIFLFLVSIQMIFFKT